MPDINSLGALERALLQVGGTPKVLEALWDGDTQGWFLRVSVYVERGIWPVKRTECHALGTVVLGTDLRLFDGQVPPWPEAELVKSFVQQTQARYGLTLYLPSEEPDEDCPRWPERARARACTDCGKPGIPTDSPYLPKEICYPCHLRREQQARIQQEQGYDEGVYLYVYQEGEYRSLGYATYFDDLAIAPYVEPALVAAAAPDTIHVVTLEGPVLVALQGRLADTLTEKLAGYQSAEAGVARSRFYHFETIQYQGSTYELELQWHEPHRELNRLFHSWQATQQAILAGASYKIYFKRGITHRDDSLLRFLKYPVPGSRSVTQLVQHYRGALTEQDIRRTLAKLAAMQCLELVGEEVIITQTGSNIV